MIYERTTSGRASGIVALERRAPAGLLAVVYRQGRRGEVIRLGDGTIVEVPGPRHRSEAPGDPPSALAVAIDGGPASVHHENLGLVAAHLPLSGVFLLPGGEVAAVYGADVVPLG